MIHETDRVVITGCGGMLGDAVYDEFKGACKVYASDIDVNTPWLERLDVSSAKDVDDYLRRIKPNYIVHLPALTDMEYCELHPQEAYATNTGGVENVAEYARAHNLPLVYISTAGIFDGKKDEYTELDTPNPLSVYGKSKYGGELVAKTVPKAVIIRAGWMMGGGPKKDKKFINKIVKQLRAGASELAVVTDKFGTPCYTYDLARSIKYLLDNQLYGVFHGACEGGCNRFAVAEAIVEQFGLSDKVTIREVNSEFFKESYFAIRPRSEELVNTKLKGVAPFLTREWKICLTEYLNKFNWNLWDLNTSGMERSFYRHYFTIDKEHWLMRIRRAIVSDNLDRYLATPADRTAVLDLGCGSGVFISELAARGFDAYGLDISAEAIKYGQLQNVKNLDVLDSHQLKFPDSAFDAVVTLDVLEHFENEDWAFREIVRVLKPGGIVVILVPAYMFLWGVQDKAAHHYRRYTVGGLLRKISEATSSFEVLRTSYFNTFLFVPIALVRFASRFLGLKNRESDFELSSPRLDRVLFGIFNLERRLLRRLRYPFGVSILVVLRKTLG
jgi:dTDP-4-dehydrorhamnose reductase